MIATNFEFNGIQAKDLGLYILCFDSPSNGAFASGSEITFNTSKPVNNYKWNYHGSHYETQLEITFQIGKYNCQKGKCEVITPMEQAYYMSWLIKKDGYKYLRFFENGYEDIYYNVSLKVQWIKEFGQVYGAEITATCDAPFGYSKQQVFDIDVHDGDTFAVYDDSDEIGAIIPDKIEIGILSAGTLSISNDKESLFGGQNTQDVMKIKDCTVGEHIIINGNTKQILSNNTSHDLANCFNYQYMRLINVDDSIVNFNSGADYNMLRTNNYTVKGCDCNINLSYRTIRKAVV